MGRAVMSGPTHDPIQQSQPPTQPGGPGNRTALTTGFDWILLAVRGLTVVPVLVLLLSALGAFAYGTALFIHSADDVIARPFPVRHNVGLFLVEVDLFLIGATLMITAIGFFELFVSPGGVGRPLLPGWLIVRDLHDLKARIISMLVLVAAVAFVDMVVNFDGGKDILFLGGGIALVIAALTAFQRFGSTSNHHP
jgi:uncharacterized membrane protein YqhA